MASKRSGAGYIATGFTETLEVEGMARSKIGLVMLVSGAVISLASGVSAGWPWVLRPGLCRGRGRA